MCSGVPYISYGYIKGGLTVRPPFYQAQPAKATGPSGPKAIRCEKARGFPSVAVFSSFHHKRLFLKDIA